tara:strand:+ start:55679 stop:56377 length:699 start_codon:yes stop_codon:yes gene_type:complete
MIKNIQHVIIAVYIGILIPLNLLGHFLDESWMILISKPLLMPFLMVYFALFKFKIAKSLNYAIIGALFFSWVGDVALLFEEYNSLLFIIGLGGFLIAHVHYIFVFLKVDVRSKVVQKLKWYAIPVFVIYTVGLVSLVWNYLGDLRIPVLIYALVLMFMAITAVSRKGKRGYYLILTGAILFVLSDSVLAINKFYTPFEGARILTMLTYTLAQLFIVLGLSKYIAKMRSYSNY